MEIAWLAKRTFADDGFHRPFVHPVNFGLEGLTDLAKSDESNLYHDILLRFCFVQGLRRIIKDFSGHVNLHRR